MLVLRVGAQVVVSLTNTKHLCGVKGYHRKVHLWPGNTSVLIYIGTDIREEQENDICIMTVNDRLTEVNEQGHKVQLRMPWLK